MTGSGEYPTLVHALEDRAEASPDAVAMTTLPEGGASRREEWTWSAWRGASARLASGLRALGVDPGDRVVVLAGAEPVWPIADLAIQWAGGVSVGVYPTAAPAQIAELLDDSGARVAIVGSDPLYEKLVEARSTSSGELAVDPEFGGGLRAAGFHSVIRADELDLREMSPDIRQFTLSTLPSGEPPALPEDPGTDAILIYTSGSTGTPKGARISHRALVASAASVRDTLGLRRGDRALSFLPYSHAAERIFGLATRVLVGMECALVPDAGRVFEAAEAYRPTVFGGLPRLYEKIHETELAERGAAARAPSPVVARLTGGAVRLATSGGASLPREVAEGLDRLGLTVLGAYGLTEHLCVAFNRPDDYSFDDVGTPMPGTELRTADDGEILVRRSDLTFSGYHERPDATRAAFTPDGEWLRTGDLGELDTAGRLRVTGRKKELIALSTGKKVAPIPIEAALVSQPWIEHAVLVGEGRKFIAALLTLRRTLVEKWAAEHGIAGGTMGLPAEPAVRAELERQVAKVNATLSRTESVREFDVLPASLSLPEGELTPTHKIRRNVILDRYADRIDALYADIPTGVAP